MTSPTRKSAVVESIITEISGSSRHGAVKTGRCISPPLGCGGPANNFTSERAEREHSISGRCEDCQNEAFSGDDDR